MTDLERDDAVHEAASKPIVQWFDDSVWRVQFVPTAAAFGAGCVVGALAALAAARYLRE